MKVVDYEGFRVWRPDVIPEQVFESVKKIVNDIKERGDRAVLEYTERFDGVKMTAEEIKVGPEELETAFESVSVKLKEGMLNSARRIRIFQERQIPEDFTIATAPGVSVGIAFRPVGSVGVYVPGGRSPYFSTVLMTLIPAKVAGVRRCAMFTPPKIGGRLSETILAAAHLTGADEVYRIGGPQAIAAMAYGTESVRKVDKIVGPGNIYVTAAKMLVSWDVAIDMPAGPSELVVYAEDSKFCEWLAEDLLAQAEHDPRAKVILVTPNIDVAIRVKEFIERENEVSQRKEILDESLSNACIVLVRDRDEALMLINEIAPEHLELVCEGAEEMLEGVENAGAVFVGEYSPVAIGDYTAGTNHVLPTMGWAKRSSPLSVRDFLKSMEVVRCTKEGIKSIGEDGKSLAEAEGLLHHARSIVLRM